MALTTAGRTDSRYTLLPLAARESDTMGVKERFSIMRLRALIQWPILLIAAFATVPAGAEVYKWVDERGVTNYSSQPPTDTKSTKKLRTVEDRVSVYTPDPALTKAVAAFQQQRIDRAYHERIDELERQLEAARRAQQYAAAATAQSTADPYYISPYLYAPAVAFIPARSQPVRFNQVQLPPSVIAGNAVGLHHFTPGNSASVATRRPARPSGTLRGFVPR